MHLAALGLSLLAFASETIHRHTHTHSTSRSGSPSPSLSTTGPGPNPDPCLATSLAIRDEEEARDRAHGRTWRAWQLGQRVRWPAPWCSLEEIVRRCEAAAEAKAKAVDAEAAASAKARRMDWTIGGPNWTLVRQGLRRCLQRMGGGAVAVAVVESDNDDDGRDTKKTAAEAECLRKWSLTEARPTQVKAEEQQQQQQHRNDVLGFVEHPGAWARRVQHVVGRRFEGTARFLGRQGRQDPLPLKPAWSREAAVLERVPM
ncbi:MAG: hypothetical protein M1826_003820 [Phylliscum demangeonii]|nr:MAG: hypothetical protein M1826_003820 [Phylliscum demangeonii]